ncbi:hypothetical protein R3I93_003807 [Phoxinus phoxinus]|uniref:Uncharacterized protein n=1 Tax=Phoxinus phoxinus TaxID=58324 RepID=A0AAN9DDZ6_9TELE
MDRRLFWSFCVMAALGSVSSEVPVLRIEKSNMTLVCEKGKFDSEPKPLTDDGASGLYTCSCLEEDLNCDSTTRARVKILSAENLIQLDMAALITVLVSNLVVTALIGWAVYSVCAQPSTRTSYQDSKASDRKSLIPSERVNNSASGGDTYQRLNTRTDEYSTLHGGRKPKNPKYPISP